MIQTKRGRALLRDALDIVAALEADYAAVLGPRRYTNLTNTPRPVLDHIDPDGTLDPNKPPPQATP